MTPTSPTPAFRLGEKTDDPLSMYLSDIYTCMANLAGVPGVSVPCGLSDTGLPIGFQLMGPHWGEPTILRLDLEAVSLVAVPYHQEPFRPARSSSLSPLGPAGE